MPPIATLTTDMQRDKTNEENLVFLEWDKIANLLNSSKRLIISLIVLGEPLNLKEFHEIV